MDRRTNESHMDFEWQNQSGPVDAASPFMNYAKQQQVLKRQLKQAQALDIEHSQDQSQGQMQGVKRTYSDFDSPQKPRPPFSAFSSSLSTSATSNPFGAHATKPTGTPAKPLPALPTPKNPSFTQFRNLDTPEFASSGGENESSPEHASPSRTNGGDSEAPTPEAHNDTAAAMGVRGALSRTRNALFSFGSPSAGKERSSHERQPAGGRGLIARPAAASGAIEKRESKRRRQNKDRRLAQRSAHPRGRRETALSDESSASESESTPLRDDETARRRRNKHSKTSHSAQQDSKKRSQGLLTSVLSFVAAHPTLPHILSFYVQLLLNLAVVLLTIYILYSFWSTISTDVQHRALHALHSSREDIDACARNYADNACGAAHVPPALVQTCAGWKLCMERDAATGFGRAKLGAALFAEIFNALVEPISYKAMIFTCVVVFGGVAASNLAFGVFRDKAAAVLREQQVAHGVFAPHYAAHQGFAGQQAVDMDAGQQWGAWPPTSPPYVQGVASGQAVFQSPYKGQIQYAAQMPYGGQEWTAAAGGVGEGVPQTPRRKIEW